MPSARIAASVLAIATLLYACGTEGTNTRDAMGPSEEAPDQTLSPAAAHAPTPASTPEPRIVTTRCPPDRRNAWLEYEYEPAQTSPADARDEFCGPVNIIVERECPSKGKTYKFLRHEYSNDEAVDEFCTSENETSAVIATSAWSALLNDRAPAGQEYHAAWTVAAAHSASSGLNTAPQLRVECIDGKLRFKVWLGGPFAAWVTQAPVTHRFDEGELAVVAWAEDTDILNPLFPVADHKVVLPAAERREFLRLLRSSDEFVWDYDDETFVGRAVFRLDGFDSDVEPVLQECGY